MFKKITGFILFGFIFLSSIISQNFERTLYKSVERDNCVWTGINSESWNDPLNWDLNEVPGINSNVLITASPVGSYFPIINSETEAFCNNLSIEQESSLQLRGFLTVHGTLSNTDENAFIILSDESGTGSLIHMSGEPKATVERYLTDGTNHFIGSSVDSATLNNLYFGGDPDVFLYKYDESIGDWITISDINTHLNPGIGYSVYVSDSKDKQIVTANFSGNLRSSDLNLSGSALNFTTESPYPGYNLISNPFTSAMSWDLGNWQAENMSGSIWLWNGSYNYLFRNAHGMGSLNNGVVPVSQAFFVRATADNAALALSAADRVHSNQNFYKSSERDNEVYIVIEVKKDDKTDEVWVAFCEECTADEDFGWDTEKLYGLDAPQLYFTQVEKSLSINALPLIENGETKTLELNFIPAASGQYSITMIQVENGGVIGELKVLLKDLLEGSEQLLSNDSTYYFDADINDEVERFELEIWEGTFGISDAELQKDYLIYSVGNTIKIEPLNSTSNKILTVQVFDLSGRMITELKNLPDHEISIQTNISQSNVVVRLITDKKVINKKLYIK